MLLYISIATILVSLVSLVGLIIAGNKIRNFLNYFIAFAAGTLIAASFFDLIPHALEEINLEIGLIFVVIGILLFFLIEVFIHWHHCGKQECEKAEKKKKPVGILIFTGDFVHNFVDGLLIASAFMLDFYTGLVATLIIIIHEIPQEFGDFAVLLHSGYSKWQAVKINFISAIFAVLGGILGYFAFDSFSSLTPYAVLIAAGGFLYIAMSDIIPELHETKDKFKKIIESLIFVSSVVLMRFFLESLHAH